MRRTYWLPVVIPLVLAGFFVWWTPPPGAGDLPGWVTIPAGHQRLGSPEGRNLEQPRDVRLPNFRMSRTEITLKQYAYYLDQQDLDLPFPAGINKVEGRIQVTRQLSRHPVAHVSLEEAKDYCSWLSRKLDQPVHLPTEDEWEYAARAGLQGGRFPWGWGRVQSRAVMDASHPHPVGRHAPNAWGLYDLAGNVAEWCEPGPKGDAVARGGSYAEHDEAQFTVFRRTVFPADYRDADVGFRVVIRE